MDTKYIICFILILAMILGGVWYLVIRDPFAGKWEIGSTSSKESPVSLRLGLEIKREHLHKYRVVLGDGMELPAVLENGKLRVTAKLAILSTTSYIWRDGTNLIWDMGVAKVTFARKEQ